MDPQAITRPRHTAPLSLVPALVGPVALQDAGAAAMMMIHHSPNMEVGALGFWRYRIHTHTHTQCHEVMPPLGYCFHYPEQRRNCAHPRSTPSLHRCPTPTDRPSASQCRPFPRLAGFVSWVCIDILSEIPAPCSGARSPLNCWQHPTDTNPTTPYPPSPIPTSSRIHVPYTHIHTHALTHAGHPIIPHALLR